MSYKAVNSGMSLNFCFLGASSPGHLNTWPLTSGEEALSLCNPLLARNITGIRFTGQRSQLQNKRPFLTAWQCFEEHQKFRVYTKWTQPFLYLFVIIHAKIVVKNLKPPVYLAVLREGAGALPQKSGCCCS